jgi:energy-coupling factor transport system permease protein
MRPVAPVEGASFIHRLNPAVKMVAAFVGSLVLIFIFDPVTPAVFYALALATMVLGARLPLSTVALAHLPFLAFAFSVFWVNLLFRSEGLVLAVIGPLTVTEPGLRIGASLALRTLVIGAYAATFVLTTDPTRLVTSLVQNVRVSPRFAYAMLAAYRFLPTLHGELAVIRRAHAMRGDGPGRGPVRRVRGAARHSLPLLVSAVRRAERVGIALESRGLGARPRRTFWRPVPVRRSDLAFLGVALTVFAAVPVLTAALGLLRGFESLTVF